MGVWGDGRGSSKGRGTEGEIQIFCFGRSWRVLPNSRKRRLRVENGIYGAPTGGTDIRQAYLPDAPGIYGGAVSAFFNSPDFRGQFGDKSTTLNPAHLNAEVLGAGLLIVYPWKPLGFTLASSFQASAQYEGETLSPGRIP